MVARWTLTWTSWTWSSFLIPTLMWPYIWPQAWWGVLGLHCQHIGCSNAFFDLGFEPRHRPYKNRNYFKLFVVRGATEGIAYLSFSRFREYIYSIHIRHFPWGWNDILPYSLPLHFTIYTTILNLTYKLPYSYVTLFNVSQKYLIQYFCKHFYFGNTFILVIWFPGLLVTSHHWAVHWPSQNRAVSWLPLVDIFITK